ncbi:hypothetical protein F5884DRAFT_749710 [Xylogone sp. PMI_703]|nr:hypothetical protein F5884DRAFT_749710 [Xylogone sp. PMI_703]
MASTSKRIITVMGSTGVQGGAVVRALSEVPEFSIRAVTRNSKSAAAQKLLSLPNVTLVEADMSKPDTLIPAFKGAEAVYAVTNFYDPSIQNDTLEEARQGCAMADIAKEQGVKLFIWSTVPSALLRTGARFNSPRLVENKFTVSQYLKYKEIPHVDLHLGLFMDNFINFGCMGKDGSGYTISQPILHPDVKLGMIWIERDLGRSVAAILKKYTSSPEILGKSLYCVSGMYSMQDVVDEVKKHTGKDTRLITTPDSGFEDLNQMYHYYNEWGLYADIQIPHPLSVETGLSLTPLPEFVNKTVVSFVRKLDTKRSLQDKSPVTRAGMASMADQDGSVIMTGIVGVPCL